MGKLLNRAFDYIASYVSEHEDLVDNELKFANDVLSIYLINAEAASIAGLCEDMLQQAIMEVLDLEVSKENSDPEIIPQIKPAELGQDPLQYRKRRGSVSASSDLLDCPKEYPKPPEISSMLLSILQSTRLIARTMNPEQMKKLVSTMYGQIVKKGQQLITQGEFGKTMYLVEEGEFQVLQGDQIAATLRPQSLFGEISLLYSFPRTASVKCTKDAKVWVATSDAYTSILVANQRKTREITCAVLERYPKYRALSIEEKDQIFRITHVMHFSEHHQIDVPEMGVFLVLSISAKIQLIGSEETKYILQGEVLRKGAIVKSQVALLFVPDCLHATIGLDTLNQASLQTREQFGYSASIMQ
ncbi:cAMP-dependent protein kinase regulator [Nematocida sp. AWRm80]|nr:cAMP-dependent protein kinase regulator [Nematocida sp. AWRm80]